MKIKENKYKMSMPLFTVYVVVVQYNMLANCVNVCSLLYWNVFTEKKHICFGIYFLSESSICKSDSLQKSVTQFWKNIMHKGFLLN